jgi:hypothetical protein
MPTISGPGVPSIGGFPIPIVPITPGILTPQQIQQCISNIGRCPATLLSQMTYSNIRFIVEEYEGKLYNQAGNRWQRLDDDLISAVQKFYSIDLHAIRYVTNINTIHGMNMTLGNDIFFTSNMDPYNTDDAHLLFHEMEHSVQYAARGGVEPFLSEYLAKSIGQVIARRSFSIHDDIDIENAAISKSNQVSQFIDTAGWTFHFYNDCQYPIKVAVNYLDDDSGQWSALGYWEIAGKTNTFLANEENIRIHTNNAIFDYYAESPDNNLLWAGDQKFTVQADGRTLGFTEANVQGTILFADRHFTCN